MDKLKQYLVLAPAIGRSKGFISVFTAQTTPELAKRYVWYLIQENETYQLQYDSNSITAILLDNQETVSFIGDKGERTNEYTYY